MYNFQVEEPGTFLGAIAGMMSGGLGGAAVGGLAGLSLGQVMYIGGMSGAGASLVGDLGDTIIKGDEISAGQALLNMVVSGALGATLAGAGYQLSKLWGGLKERLFKPAEGGGSTIKNNLGKEIDITPSSNHSTTTKNPGLKGEPNSSVDILDSNGNRITRRWYGPEGKQIRDVDFTNHGNPKAHSEWPHEHGPRR